MIRSFTTLGLAFFLAQASCGLDSCDSKDCKSSTSESLGVTAPGGLEHDTTVIGQKHCSTCGHAEFDVKLTFPSDATGNAELLLSYSCGGIAGFWHEAPVFEPGKLGVLIVDHKWSDVNVKNRCGDNAAIRYSVELVNRTDTNIIASTKLTCRVNESASPTGPTASRLRPWGELAWLAAPGPATRRR